MNVSEMLESKRVCVCAGSGGVGKTTTSAAIALGMAAQGAKVAVVTIDPANRLANALGLRGARERAASRRARPAGHRGPRGQGRAVGDDARPQANVRRADRPDRPGSRAGRGDQGQPGLSRAVHRRLGLAGAHGDRQALRARSGGAASTCSCSTRPRRATRSSSSTRRAGSTRSSRAGRSRPSCDPPAWGCACSAGGRSRCCSALRRITGIDLISGPVDVLPAARET